MAKTTPPEFPSDTPKKDKVPVGSPMGFNETPLEYTQRVLGQYNNIESDIPVSHDYWRIKRSIK